MYSALMGEWNPPAYAIRTTGKTFQLAKRNNVLKRAESHHCEVNTFAIPACNFSKVFKVPLRNFFRILLTESERSD